MTRIADVRFPIHGRLALAIGKVGVVLGVACVVAACDVPRSPGPGVGERVDVDLATLDGTRVTSTDWRGKTVVLNVWASWCAPCRAEMASLEALSRAADPSQLLVIGVTVDEDRNLAREYVLREGIGFVNLSDGSQQVAKRALGAQALPTTLIVGPDGRLKAKVAGAKDWMNDALLEGLGLREMLK